MWGQIFYGVCVDSLQNGIGTLHAVHAIIVRSSDDKAREGLRGFGGARRCNTSHPILMIWSDSDLFIYSSDSPLEWACAAVGKGD
jgi:hypothetical protein